MYITPRIVLSKQSPVRNIIYNEIKKKFNRNPENNKLKYSDFLKIYRWKNY